MKNRQHILPCGRVIVYEEIGPEDISSKFKVRKIILANKSEFVKYVPYDRAGRKPKLWSNLVFNKLTSLIIKKFIDHLMESDRIETTQGRKWAIAGREDPTSKHLNWHTEGKTFGVRILGLPGEYGISMSVKRRIELMNRIKSGQNYHKEVRKHLNTEEL